MDSNVIFTIRIMKFQDLHVTEMLCEITHIKIHRIPERKIVINSDPEPEI